MIEVSEISSGEGRLKEWFEALPQATEVERQTLHKGAILLAQRAALRTFPLIWYWSTQDPNKSVKLAMLWVLRNALTYRILAYSGAPEIAAVIDSNDVQVRSVDVGYSIPQNTRAYLAFSVLDASVSLQHAIRATEEQSFPELFLMVDKAAGYAHTATGDATAIVIDTHPSSEATPENATPNEDAITASLQALRRDARALLAGEDLNALPLWRGENPLHDHWSRARAAQLEDDESYRFWIDWYDKALNGKSQDWDLLTKVALIPSKDWDKGADHVNAKIARIVREHGSKPVEPEPLVVTELIRAQAQFVVSALIAAQQSAANLRTSFEKVEQTYRAQFGCPNETPEELEPFVTLARTYGEIERLLSVVDDRDRQIIALEAKIAALEQQNAALIAALGGPRSSIWRDLFAAALGGTIATVVGGLAKDHFFVGGLAVADSIPAFQQLIDERPRIDYEVSVPITPVSP